MSDFVVRVGQQTDDDWPHYDTLMAKSAGVIATVEAETLSVDDESKFEALQNCPLHHRFHGLRALTRPVGANRLAVSTNLIPPMRRADGHYSPLREAQRGHPRPCRRQNSLPNRTRSSLPRAAIPCIAAHKNWLRNTSSSKFVSASQAAL